MRRPVHAVGADLDGKGMRPMRPGRRLEKADEDQRLLRPADLVGLGREDPGPVQVMFRATMARWLCGSIRVTPPRTGRRN